jgi:tRNA(Ser,Leu) C12 N-acetylase TAN1
MVGESMQAFGQKSATPDWNVTVTLAEPTFGIARNMLARWGQLRRTRFFNVAVMKVADAPTFLREFSAAVEETPGILNAMSHVVPFGHVFAFEDAAEFEAKLRDIILSYAPQLAGKSFHVRLRRRGLKGIISTPEEERVLDDVLLEALADSGTPGHISFEDPHYVVLIETVGQGGGVSLWTGEDLERYPFLGAA